MRGPIAPSAEAQLGLLAGEPLPAPAPLPPAPAEKIRKKRAAPLVSLSLFPEDPAPAVSKHPRVRS